MRFPPSNLALCKSALSIFSALLPTKQRNEPILPKFSSTQNLARGKLHATVTKLKLQRAAKIVRYPYDFGSPASKTSNGLVWRKQIFRVTFQTTQTQTILMTAVYQLSLFRAIVNDFMTKYCICVIIMTTIKSQNINDHHQREEPLLKELLRSQCNLPAAYFIAKGLIHSI